MQGELEAYFATLGALGGCLLATDRAGTLFNGPRTLAISRANKVVTCARP
jgi:hypothetical protein